MGDLNNVMITGRLVRDPIIRNTTATAAIGLFTLAANRCFKARSGEFQEEVAFVPCVVFGRWTDALAHRMKGEMLLVSGRLRTESWEEDGDRRTQLSLVCDSVRFFSAMQITGLNGDSARSSASDEFMQPDSTEEMPS